MSTRWPIDGLVQAAEPPGERRRIIGSTENCRTSDQYVCTGGEDSSRVIDFDATIDLEQRAASDALKHASCCAHLVEAGLDECLSAESWVHGHDQEKIDVRKNFFDGVQ